MFLRGVPASIRRVGWTTSAYGVTQALRLGTNVVLARLLSPELFGIMLIVNTVRTGMELLSDIGIGQNVVKSRNGDEPAFLDTAWTIQLVRGLLLMSIALVAAYPLAQIYDLPLLFPIIAIASLNFVALGFSSVQGFVLKRRLDLRRFSIFEVIVAFATALIHIGFAIASQSIWALVWAGVVSSVISALLTHRLVPGLRHRIRFDRTYAREIFGFGKWIFASSLLYFCAMNFDRLYLAGAVPMAVLGVYGIAKSLTDIISVFVVRLGDHVIFPTVAASGLDRAELRTRLARIRPRFLLLAAGAVAGFSAGSDILVGLLYDQRYSLAAAMLPVMSIGIWFGILSTTGEALLLGVGRPSYATAANALKLGALVIGVPYALANHGLAAAIVTFAAVEFIRYAALAAAMEREKLSFLIQDIFITAALIVAALVLRYGLEALGLGTGPQAFWFGEGAWQRLNGAT